MLSPAAGANLFSQAIVELRDQGTLLQRDDLVECRHVMAGADLAGILGVVFEVLVGHDPVLVADQAELGHTCRVEVDLDFDVLGDGDQGRAHLLDQAPCKPRAANRCRRNGRCPCRRAVRAWRP